jgi:uncharacterized integral membrane protein
MQRTQVAEAEPVKGRFTRVESEERELPEAPSLLRLVGPSVIMVGVGIASGEYILYPFIASQAGLVFLWAAVVGILIQFFINMEIERYTLATGETAVGGFMRMWKPWGGILAAGAILATMWPGWATSAATIATFAFGGGNPTTIAVLSLLAIGLALTASPVVYQTMEKTEFLKVGAVVLFLIVALFAVISSTAYEDTTQIATSFGTFPSEISIAILVGAFAASGGGGAHNLVMSNWIRDKGFGMGRYIPRIVSPITGKEEAAPDSERLSFPQDDANLSRWRVWWQRANVEQFVSFAVIGALTIIIFSLVAYSTVFDNPDLPAESGFDFIALEADVLDDAVGSWFGTLFLAIGAVSLFAAALGIIDYVARLVADVINVGYTRDRPGITESRLYFGIVWSMVAFGSAILLIGVDQPLVLVTISTVLGGAIMMVYTCLLLVTNRRYLPEAIRLRGYRIGVLLFAVAALAVTTAIVAVDQFGNLL